MGTILIKGKMIGHDSSKSKLAIYKHYVKTGRVPKTLPAWAKKKLTPKQKALPTKMVFPVWTYKKSMRDYPSIIPQEEHKTTAKYVKCFNKLNHLIAA